MLLATTPATDEDICHVNSTALGSPVPKPNIDLVFDATSFGFRASGRGGKKLLSLREQSFLDEACRRPRPGITA